jgi:hypothetical protein
MNSLAAHRAPQALGLAGGEAGERPGDFDDLVLEDDCPEGLFEHLLEAGVRVGDLEVWVAQDRLSSFDVWVDGAADDRPGTHQRDLDREVRERLGLGAIQRADLRARLDLEHAGRVGFLDHPERRRVIEGDPREVDSLAACVSDQLHAPLHRGEHPQTQQVDLQEPRV